MNAILAWILSTFLFLSPAIFAQPTTAPDTRTSPYADGVAPDKYGVWPTEDFETGQAPLWLQTWLLQPAYNLRGLLAFGSQNDSIVALYKGKIVYEWYADGWDQDTQHTINSATKSVTSALVGIAIAEGYINSIEDKVVDYFPDLDILIDKERKEQITIA
ncbi:MAG: serine hydrolase, partial [Oscillospiraceae bacterium]|nr:serine hydrolase [Oscillospiraceae bacterium]